tara:strand:- start:116 stop:583 length:468 start_codon:yes stop_codon:yes gene_type:complete
MYSSNIIFVAGTICSGKSWFASKLADDLDYDFVEVSRIVGGILSSNMRNDLQNHPELDVQIVAALKDIRKSTRKDGLVISGPRQVELLRAFPEAETIWMDTPIEVCLHRFYERDAEKDGTPTLESFNDFMDKDEELGLKEVEKYITLNNFKKNKI